MNVAVTVDLDLLKMGWFWVATVTVTAWIAAELYYWRKVKALEGRLNLGSIQVKGGIAESLGDHQARLLLLAQISRIIRTFRKDRTGHSRFYTASVIGDRFKGVHTVLLYTGRELKAPEITISEDWVLRYGPISIPIGAMLKFLMILLRLGLPVPHRTAYMKTRINVSIVAVEEETQVVVFRGEGMETAPSGSVPETAGQPGAGTKTSAGKVDAVEQEGGAEHSSVDARVLAKTQAVKMLSDMDDLIRTGAFMVLQLHGRAFPGRKAESMRYFADGLDALDEYHRTRKEVHRSSGESLFGQAARIDAGNFPALYFHASLLLHQRSRAGISAAQQGFKRCLQTDSPRLKALAHVGLANCYIQSHHRLAVRDKDTLRHASHHAETARSIWLEAPPDPDYDDRWRRHLDGAEPPQLHPWILSTLILVDLVNEGGEGSRDADVQRFVKAAGRYADAMKVEEKHPDLFNNLGWALLKLAEWDIESIGAEEGAPESIRGPVATSAEENLQKALDLSPYNKLTHANLCLLYATSHFREHPDREKFLRRCRFHGLQAVRIDPEYVNGFRDLAVSLLRYGKYEEAYGHFTTALRLSPVIEKDEEIIDAAVAIVTKTDAAPTELARWQNPDRELLLPLEPSSETADADASEPGATPAGSPGPDQPAPAPDGAKPAA